MWTPFYKYLGTYNQLPGQHPRKARSFFTCRICDEIKKADKSSTSNLKRYMSRMHPKNPLWIDSKEGALDMRTEAERRSAELPGSARRQRQISGYFGNRSQLRITEAVQDLITDDIMPFSTVEKPGFKRFFAFAFPEARLVRHLLL